MEQAEEQVLAFVSKYVKMNSAQLAVRLRSWTSARACQLCVLEVQCMPACSHIPLPVGCFCSAVPGAQQQQQQSLEPSSSSSSTAKRQQQCGEAAAAAQWNSSSSSSTAKRQQQQQQQQLGEAAVGMHDTSLTASALIRPRQPHPHTSSLPGVCPLWAVSGTSSGASQR